MLYETEHHQGLITLNSLFRKFVNDELVKEIAEKDKAIKTISPLVKNKQEKYAERSKELQHVESVMQKYSAR